jgi:hypothetical protein
MKQNHKQIVNDLVFEYLNTSDDKTRGETLSKLEAQGVEQDTLDELIINHFYLAPNNLKKTQILLTLVTIFLPLSIVIVRMGNDFSSILLVLLLSTLLASPFFIFNFLIRNLLNLNHIKVLSWVSFAYSMFLSIILVVICIRLELLGVIFIPLLILFFYFLELLKLNKLIKQLKSNNAT